MLDCIKKNEDGSYSPVGNYSRLINAGCSWVYKGDDILKIYYSYIPEHLRITEEIFDILKNLDSDNFVRLKDYYIDKKMIGYTSDFIPSEPTFNFIDKDIEYVKYNLMKIEKLILLFTKLGILVADVNYRNYLLSGDNLVLIDPDSYRFYKDKDEIKEEGNEELSVLNYKTLLSSFMNLYVNSYYKVFHQYKIGSVDFNMIMADVFQYDESDKSPVYTACKRLEELRLSKYKKN